MSDEQKEKISQRVKDQHKFEKENGIVRNYNPWNKGK